MRVYASGGWYEPKFYISRSQTTSDLGSGMFTSWYELMFGGLNLLMTLATVGVCTAAVLKEGLKEMGRR